LISSFALSNSENDDAGEDGLQGLTSCTSPETGPVKVLQAYEAGMTSMAYDRNVNQHNATILKEDKNDNSSVLY